MSVAILTPERMRAMFNGADVSPHGLQPLLVRISNRSKRSYFFNKQFTPSGVPWYTAAKGARPLTPGEQRACRASRLIGSVLPFSIANIDRGLPDCEVEFGVGVVFQDRAFADTDGHGQTLRPGQTITGLVFVRADQLADTFRLELPDQRFSKPTLILEVALSNNAAHDTAGSGRLP